ncbi:MAG TPA: hypothetical protein DCY94_01690 [Firmicutes bacterium]|nr:hypothetical protein [Bacillota bacterium]
MYHMKDDLKKYCIYFAVLIIGLLFAFETVNAETYSSGYMSVNGSEPISYRGTDIDISQTNFYKWNKNNSTNGNLGNLHGKIDNVGSQPNLEVYLTAYYYNQNYNLIAISTKTENVRRDSNFQQFINVILAKDDFLGTATIEDIVYYKLSFFTMAPIDNTSTLDPTTNTNEVDFETYYSSVGYALTGYDVDIKVNENNTFDVTETITAYFKTPKHGIIRTIPLKNSIYRTDGSTSENRAQIKDLSVDAKYKPSKQNGNLNIKIGDANETLTGEQRYTIKYTYNIGKDPLKDKDELYYNIIGTEWDTAIKGVTFKITMPKEFDKTKLGFSSGSMGSIDNENVTYEIEDNTITGSYTDVLEARQGLTIRCELPEGYFKDAKYFTNPLIYVSVIISITFSIVAILIWRKYGKDDMIVETVEFYPPKNMNSLEVGFIYNGKVENKDVTSLLIYLANKGYLEISDKQIDLESSKLKLSKEKEEKIKSKIAQLEKLMKEEATKDPNSPKIKYYENMINVYKDIDKPIDYEAYGLESEVKRLNKKSKFTIKKLKDYDGINVFEELFMDGLFDDDSIETNDNLLYDNFYVTNNKIKKMMNKKENREQIFEKVASSKKKFLIMILVIVYFLISIPPAFSLDDASLIPLALIFPAIGFTILISLTVNGIKSFKSYPLASLIEIFFGLVWGGAFGGIPWLLLILIPLLSDPTSLIMYIVGIISIVIILLCINYLPKRTKYGSEMLGKLRGFKNFLETAEKKKLEELVEDNPTYFYDILPYTYVLGVSKKWIEKFETISMEAPNWYSSTSAFSITTFNSFINTTMNTANTAMSSSPSSSGSGGGGSSSGGGSSGGGSGGGGGSSW